MIILIFGEYLKFKVVFLLFIILKNIRNFFTFDFLKYKLDTIWYQKPHSKLKI